MRIGGALEEGMGTVQTGVMGDTNAHEIYVQLHHLLGCLTDPNLSGLLRAAQSTGWRCPEWVVQVEDDPTGGKFAGASGLLQGAPHKLEDIINFHAGDTVTALQRASMQPGGREVILYGTVMGAIGAVLICSACNVVSCTRHSRSHRIHAAGRPRGHPVWHRHGRHRCGLNLFCMQCCVLHKAL